ncbi:MAG: toprim domain-containing protein, partial [Candidatus Paceibacterota bacterium]
MYPPSIQKLIGQFSKFPTVGPRTAARFVFYLLKIPKEEAESLQESISQLKEKVRLCSFCFNPFEGEEELCEICDNPGRDKSTLCVVEKEPDLEAIEKTKQYKGRYFILGGTVSRLRKEDVKSLRTKELIERAENPEIKEIILA